MKVGNRCLRLMDLEHLSIQTAASEEIQVVSKDEECVSLDIVPEQVQGYLKQGAAEMRDLARPTKSTSAHFAQINLPTYPKFG